jgi:kynurenine formamidase
MTEQFVGSVALGGAVNFRDVQFNPHGNGTHTECVGHIAKEFYSIHQVLQRFFFLAQVWTVQPEQQATDEIISLAQVRAALLQKPHLEALVIRTLPNSDEKKQRQYSNTNPPYMEAAAAAWLYEQGIRHILIDTPSVDREEDEGVLAAHHAFWNYPDAPRLDATITELIYVPNAVADGLYLLNLQVAAFENDATPSQPTLYALL